MSSKKTTQTLNSICRRAHYLANRMIFEANNRKDKSKGDPKIGGHSSASSSALHILGALHLVVKTGYDHIANKPHASPADHSYNYLMDLFLNEDFSKLTEDEKNQAMMNLRAFPTKEAPHVFQSYHSIYDCDHHNFFPSGTVGIPPVNAGYLALAYRFAREHGYNVPDAHFWCIIGDSEFREGSLFEATPDFAERELGQLTWIVDYNRQSLDGHRMVNKSIMNGTDADRIERTMAANGWEVIQVRHGQTREELFKSKQGQLFKTWLEDELSDYDLQSMLLIKDPELLMSSALEKSPQLAPFLKSTSADKFHQGLRDFGGHDIEQMTKALEDSKKDQRRPTIIVAHTLKGWGLDMAASQGNHSALPPSAEIDALQAAQGIDNDKMFATFESSTPEFKYLKKRGDALLTQIIDQNNIKESNQAEFAERAQEIPDSLNINTKMANYPHTQWMLGQCTAKLTRIANTSLENVDSKKKDLKDDEKAWKLAAEMLTTMAPDVGTSTNLNPAMDGKIFGAPTSTDLETEFGVRDKKLPNLIPGEENSDRFIRFEIAEANTMSCMGSYGRMRDLLGIPILPLMTVYDFFIKRAHDQYFYNLYWKSSFILVGTPSGITLSPEGAQHGWKSDFQIPNQITWEPTFIQELDWILSDAVQRHMTGNNEGRSGVLVRGVTRGINQKLLMQNLKSQSRFKQDPSASLKPAGSSLESGTDESTIPSLDEALITSSLREDVLKGAYYLRDFRNYANYEPGDNVVHIFSMGALITEALDASDKLLEKGIYGNVIVVTSSDLLCGQQAFENNYQLLKQDLQIDGRLVLQPAPNGNASQADIVTLAGRRTPIVSVHDGEPGLLDNIGSIIGVRHESLAVRKHSKCGRPDQIYNYHGLDGDAIVEATGKVLSETAMENVQIHRSLIEQGLPTQPQTKWQSYWD